MIIYKILLDILGSYLRLFFGSDSKIYKKQFLPTIIEFYTKVDNKNLSEVVNILMESLSHLDKNDQAFLMKRFINGILCLPANDMQRIAIVMKQEYKEYYIGLYSE